MSLNLRFIKWVASVNRMREKRHWRLRASTLGSIHHAASLLIARGGWSTWRAQWSQAIHTTAIRSRDLTLSPPLIRQSLQACLASISSWTIVNDRCLKLLNLGEVFTKWLLNDTVRLLFFIYFMLFTSWGYLQDYNTIHSTKSSKGKKETIFSIDMKTCSM